MIGFVVLPYLGCMRFMLVPIFGLAGCLVPQEPLSPAEAKAAMTAPADKAVLVILMATGNRGGADVIDESNRCLAFVDGYKRFTSQLAPGRHQIIALGGPGQTRAITVELAAGKSYFLEARPESPGGELVLVPIRPGTNDWSNLDEGLRQTKPFEVDQPSCPKHLENARPGWGSLIAKTKESTANLPPSLTPADGVVWRGSAASSRAE